MSKLAVRYGIVALVIALTFTACAAPTSVPSNSLAVVLEKDEVRNYFGSTWTVTFPKGRYQPFFQTKDGVYYTAPAPLLIKAIGNTAETGGIFIPGPGDADQKQGFWFQNAGHPTHTIAVRQQLDFRYSP